MKIELSEEDVKFLKTSLNYVALSLDGSTPDNIKLDDKSKCLYLGKCFYLMQMLDNPIENTKKKEINVKPIQQYDYKISKKLLNNMLDELSKGSRQAEYLQRQMDNQNGMFEVYFPWG